MSIEKITREDGKRIFRSEVVINDGLLFLDIGGLLHIYTYSEDNKTSKFIGLIKKEEIQEGIDFLYSNDKTND